jgi:hypothetical protein
VSRTAFRVTFRFNFPWLEGILFKVRTFEKRDDVCVAVRVQRPAW